MITSSYVGVTGNKLIYIFIDGIVLISISCSSGNKMWEKKNNNNLLYTFKFYCKSFLGLNYISDRGVNTIISSWPFTPLYIYDTNLP